MKRGCRAALDSRHRHRLLCPSVRVESSGRFPFTSRWQPFPHRGLWSLPSERNDSIRDPCLAPTLSPDHEDPLFPSSPTSLPLYPPFSLYLAKIIRLSISRTDDPEPTRERSAVFLVTACFAQFPPPLYSFGPYQLLFIFVLSLLFFFQCLPLLCLLEPDEA